MQRANPLAIQIQKWSCRLVSAYRVGNCGMKQQANAGQIPPLLRFQSIYWDDFFKSDDAPRKGIPNWHQLATFCYIEIDFKWSSILSNWACSNWTLYIYVLLYPTVLIETVPGNQDHSVHLERPKAAQSGLILPMRRRPGCNGRTLHPWSHLRMISFRDVHALCIL